MEMMTNKPMIPLRKNLEYNFWKFEKYIGEVIIFFCLLVYSCIDVLYLDIFTCFLEFCKKL